MIAMTGLKGLFQGRQLLLLLCFHLTAQHSEMSRNREMLNEIGLRLQLVDLGLQGRVGSLMSSRM